MRISAPSFLFASSLLLSCCSSPHGGGVKAACCFKPSAHEIEAAKLRGVPTHQYQFSSAMLGDILRFVANDAGISVISLPDNSAESNRLVTMETDSSPFATLETLCEANGLSLTLEDGTWYIRSNPAVPAPATGETTPAAPAPAVEASDAEIAAAE